MLNKVDGTWEIEIPCGCNTEKIVINKFDDNYDEYWIGFYVDSFYNQSLTHIFIDRLKMAWEALLKGNYIHQEMLLSGDKIKELRDNLNKVIRLAECEEKCDSMSVKDVLEKCDACEDLDASEGCTGKMKPGKGGTISMALYYCPECGRILK
jgi:hypothetical protein